MFTIHGKSPSGKSERELSVWLSQQGVTLGIHPPQAPDGGWQIRLSREELQKLLDELHQAINGPLP